MSALNFPDDPASVGNVYVGDNGITYDYINGKWRGRTAAGNGGSGNGFQLTSSTAVVSLAADGVLTLPEGGTIDDTNNPGTPGIFISRTFQTPVAPAEQPDYWFGTNRITLLLSDADGTQIASYLALGIGVRVWFTVGDSYPITSCVQVQAEFGGNPYGVWNVHATGMGNRFATIQANALIFIYTGATPNTYTNFPQYVPPSGYITLSKGVHDWIFGTDGNLTLPNGASIGSSDSLSGIPLTTDRGTVLFGNQPEQCEPVTSSSHFHIMKQDPGLVDLFFGDDFNYVKLPSNNGVVIGTFDGVNPPQQWQFGTDGTTIFPDNTIKNTTSTNITVAGVAGITSSLAWYNIFGELNNSTSTNITIDGSVVYDTEGNLFVLGSTYADGDNFPGANLFLKYSPQGELLWRKTWTDPVGDACGSYNASMRFWPAESTATVDAIVWASNGDSWTTSDRSGYIGTMDLEGNLVDLQGQARAPLALPDYRITDIVPLLYPGFDGAYVSGSWYDRADTGWNFPAIAGVDFNDINDNVNWIFIPTDLAGGSNGGGHFKSINAVFGGLWATGSYNTSANGYYVNRTILGLLDIIGGDPGSPTPYLYTFGNNYPEYSMWIEDSGSDADSNIYGLINVWGYNNDTSIQYNNHTVLASATLNSTLTIDRWQKKIRRAGADDGSLNVHGLGLVNHEGYVYVSVLLSDNSGGDGDVGLLKLDADTGAVVWARTIGSPFSEGAWSNYEGGYGSSSDIVVDPTGNYISFTAITQDQSTGTNQSNNFTIQYPLDGSLLGTFNDFEITDSIAEFVVTDHDFDVVDITGTANITTATFTVTTATLTASATTVGEGWTNFRWPLEAEVTGTADKTWTFGQDGNLTIPDDIQDANGSVVRVATTSTAPTRVNGQLWFNSEEGRTYIKYNGQWLDASPTQIPSPETYLDDIQIDGSTLSVGDYAWTFGGATDTFPGDIYDAEGPIVRVATTSTAPTRANGQLWFNSEEGRTYIKYNDAWVDANPTQIPSPETYLDDIQVDGSEFLINGYSLTVDETGTLLVDGQQVTGSGAATDSITSGSYSVSVADTGVVTMATSRGNVEFGALPEIIGGPSHFHIMKSSEDTGMDLFFGDDYNYVLQRGNSQSESEGHLNDYGVEIGTRDLSTGTTNQYVWRFETDGVLTLSTASTILGNSEDPNVYIETSTTATTSTWTFGTNGILTLPAATPVIKGGGTGTDVAIVASTGTNPAVWTFEADGSLTLPNGMIIDASDSIPTVTIGGPNTKIRIDDGGAPPGFYITTNATSSTAYGWLFGPEGELEFPQGATISETIGTTGTHGTTIIQAGTNDDLLLKTLDYVNSTIRTWTFGRDGTTLFPDAAIDGGTAPIELKSRSWSQLTYNNADMTPAPNKNHSTTFFVEGGDALLEIFRWDGDSVLQHRQWTFSNDGDLSLPYTGTITFPDATVQTTAWTGTSALVNGTYTVALSITGQLNLPSAANTESSNARIQSANSIDILSNLSKWTFSSTGTITFPNSTVQTTAYVAANVVNKTSGSWTLAPGANTVSITVAPGGNYQMWVNGNIDNGIVTWNATVSTSNTNVPVVGSQYGWYYAAGNMLVLTSMPNQIVGTAGSISTATVATTSSNVFRFGITNNSVSTQTVYWGYTTL